MAINKNHLFDDLDGVKCAIVETNVSPERIEFLKQLLEYNNYKVVVVTTPPPKTAPPPKPVEARPDEPVGRAGTDGDDSRLNDSVGQAVGRGEPEQPITVPEIPETFTLGVTDVTFNAINAIFGRTLKTRTGHIVSLAFWQQREAVSHDEIPYYEKK